MGVGEEGLMVVGVGGGFWGFARASAVLICVRFKSYKEDAGIFGLRIQLERWSERMQ